MADLRASDGKRKRFLEQAAGVLARGGDLETSEVTWRVRHLTLKWDSVMHVLSPDYHSLNSTASGKYVFLRLFKILFTIFFIFLFYNKSFVLLLFYFYSYKGYLIHYFQICSIFYLYKQIQCVKYS